MRCAELLGRAAARIDAELGQRVTHLFGLERLVDRRIQPRGHLGRRAGLQQETGPVLAGELRIAGLDDGRHVRQRRDAFCPLTASARSLPVLMS